MRSLRESSSSKAVLGLLTLTTLIWGTLMFAVVPTGAAQVHTDGSVVVSGGTIWHITGGQRHGFPSGDIYMSHGYTFGQALPATAGDMALPAGANMTWADGTLVNDGGTVYMVNQGMRRGFTSGAVFTGLGFSFVNVYNGSTAGFTDGAVVSSASAAHPAGSLVVSGGTVWFVRDSGRAGVSDLATFN